MVFSAYIQARKPSDENKAIEPWSFTWYFFHNH
jgi:hypothetical protein